MGTDDDATNLGCFGVVIVIMIAGLRLGNGLSDRNSLFFLGGKQDGGYQVAETLTNTGTGFYDEVMPFFQSALHFGSHLHLLISMLIVFDSTRDTAAGSENRVDVEVSHGIKLGESTSLQKD